MPTDNASRELMFHRSAAYDGIHPNADIATNGITEMRKFIKRRIQLAFAIAKRDPLRVAEFITDMLILTGFFSLIVIAVKTAKCVGVV